MSTVRREFNENAAPNPVQQEFIRLAAEKYWYLGLGDTDHTNPNIRTFALSASMLTALTSANRKHYFLEQRPYIQDYLEWASQQERLSINKSYYKAARQCFQSMWLDQVDGARLCDFFEENAKEHPEIQFFAPDVRHSDPFLRLKYQISKIVEKVETAIPALFDKAADQLILRAQRLITTLLAQDRKTSLGIMMHNAPSVILYGEGHFRKNCDNPRRPHLLVNLLPGPNKDLCVLNIFETFNQQAKEKFSAADADLLIFPTEENPEGIIIKNPALQPLFDQAVTNVLQRQRQFTVPALLSTTVNPA